MGLAVVLIAVLGSGCAFHLVSVRTTSVIEPVAGASGVMARMTPEEAAFVLNLVKALPLVEWFTDQVVKEKAIEAAIAAGVPVRYTTTRETSWFVWRHGR